VLRIAAPLVLGVVLPLLLLAPFQFFRVEFLNASVALAVPFIASLLVFWARAPKPETPKPARVRWDRIGPALAVLLLAACAGVRAVLPHPGGYFEKHLEQARVTLGPVPCDYFNWQGERWECSNFDHGQDPLMTGRSLPALPRFQNRPFAGIAIAPGVLPPRTFAPRKIEYPDVPLGQTLEVQYGHADGTSSRGHEAFRVLVNDQPTDLPLGAPGELKSASIDTRSLAGQKARVAFEVATDVGYDAPVYFDGAPK
jgi:hypothetical protein